MIQQIVSVLLPISRSSVDQGRIQWRGVEGFMAPRTVTFPIANNSVKKLLKLKDNKMNQILPPPPKFSSGSATGVDREPIRITCGTDQQMILSSVNGT